MIQGCVEEGKERTLQRLGEYHERERERERERKNTQGKYESMLKTLNIFINQFLLIFEYIEQKYI